MNRGKGAARQPQFFRGENYFHPAFFTWKMAFQYGLWDNTWGPILDGIDYPFFSEPGVVLSEHQIRYDFLLDVSPMLDTIRVEITDSFQLGARYTEWKVAILLEGFEQFVCYWYESVPQFFLETFYNFFYPGPGLPVPSPIPTAQLQITGATYEEVGTPYLYPRQ